MILLSELPSVPDSWGCSHGSWVGGTIPCPILLNSSMKSVTDREFDSYFTAFFFLNLI